MAISSGLSVALGIWGCRYRELKPITFGGGTAVGNNPSVAADVDGDEESGFGRGRDRGRGRDGNGEYELADMGPEDEANASRANGGR